MRILRRVNFETDGAGVGVLTLADHADVRGQRIVLRRAPGDDAPTVTSGEASTVGGISASLDGWHLHVVLDPEAAKTLGLPEENDFFLELSRFEIADLRDGLAAVLD